VVSGIEIKESAMGIVLLVLLLALLFGGAGFAIHALWIVAVVLFVAWLIGFALRSGESCLTGCGCRRCR